MSEFLIFFLCTSPHFTHQISLFQEPEKFTVKKAEKATIEFWSAPKKKEVKLYVYIIKIEKYN